MSLYTDAESKIKWIDAVSSAHASRNEAWRRGVGPPVIRNFTRAGNRALDQLVIASWNVHVGSGDIHVFLQHLQDGQFTGGEPVRDYVLLIQETFRSGGAVPHPMPSGARSARPILYPDSQGQRYDAESIARSAGLFVAYAPSMRNGPLANPRTEQCEDRGNAIFSTIPLEDITAVELPLLHQRRVAVLGHLRGHTPNGVRVDLQLGTIHFDLKATPWGRSAQARAVAKAANAPDCIIAGDTNVLPFLEGTLSVLTKAFPQSHLHDAKPTHIAHINRRIDFQFSRLNQGCQAMPYVRIPNLYGSDHYPLVGMVKFSPAR